MNPVPNTRYYLRHAWLALVDAIRCAVGGPVCQCGETAWSAKSARRRGWRFGTAAGGEAEWICDQCLRAQTGHRQW